MITIQEWRYHTNQGYTKYSDPPPSRAWCNSKQTKCQSWLNTTWSRLGDEEWRGGLTRKWRIATGWPVRPWWSIHLAKLADKSQSEPTVCDHLSIKMKVIHTQNNFPNERRQIVGIVSHIDLPESWMVGRPVCSIWRWRTTEWVKRFFVLFVVRTFRK